MRSVNGTSVANVIMDENASESVSRPALKKSFGTGSVTNSANSTTADATQKHPFTTLEARQSSKN